MPDHVQIEHEIRELVRTETRATVLSNKLFGQHVGLFCRLADDEAGRRAVSQSELFRHAQNRVHELQRREVEALRKAVAAVREELPGTDFSLRLDTAVAPR